MSAPSPVPPRTNELVVGPADASTLDYCLDRLAAAERRAVLVSTDAPADSVAAAYRSLAGGDAAPLTIVDCASLGAGGSSIGAAPTTPSGPFDASAAPPSSVDVVRPAENCPAAVAETVLRELSADATPAVDRVGVDSVSSLLARSHVQEVYRLLYLLARRVRTLAATGVCTYDTPGDEKALRIVRQPFDRQVTLDARGGVEVAEVAAEKGGVDV